ncbi:MAG: fimbrial family protein [Novosphingobium sp.]|nr:fimbrial family protein [Novosphingobium sp.]
MSRKYIFGFITVPLMTALSIGSANASDGTISFSGSVNNATCTVQVNNSAASATVTLPTVSRSVLASNGQVAGATRFTLNLSGCTTGNTVSAYFEAGSTVDTVTGNLINGGTASNVQVQLLTGAGAPISVGSSSQATTTGIAMTASPAVTAGILHYAAQYYATGIGTAGSVTTSVTYSLTYL